VVLPSTLFYSGFSEAISSIVRYGSGTDERPSPIDEPCGLVSREFWGIGD
jgi:hypothetical protein